MMSEITRSGVLCCNICQASSALLATCTVKPPTSCKYSLTDTRTPGSSSTSNSCADIYLPLLLLLQFNGNMLIPITQEVGSCSSFGGFCNHSISIAFSGNWASRCPTARAQAPKRLMGVLMMSMGGVLLAIAFMVL